MEEDLKDTEATSEGENKNNQMMVVLGVIGLLVVGAIVVLAMKGGSTNSTANTQSQSSTESAQADTDNDLGMMESGEAVEGTATISAAVDPNAKQIQIEAGSFYFKPNTLTVKNGQKVQLVFHSVSMMHDFNIDELNVHGPVVKNGDTQTITFTPSKAGTFEYYCSVGQHRKMGQIGKITVTE